MRSNFLINPLLVLFRITAIIATVNSCQAQTPNNEKTTRAPSTRPVGGECEGCDLMWVGIPAQIDSRDTSAGWKEAGQKLIISGRIFMKDGRTPAPGTIVYYYHTDNQGYYSPAAGLPPEVMRHGHLRGWVKSDKEGNYSIFTIRPVPYPKEDIPAHLHLFVKEPSIANEYYIDELVFDDDKFLTTSHRARQEHRGGSGIMKVRNNGGVQVATHDIILGLNIPDYPDK
ncbi:MAG: intradiol ring-cleavage dioxygenase [Chitinophagaceae bacterium]|nr:MAG: intradiol ring-cleavage dioxygenase [Chitinophagaceae bacterium]